MKKKNSVRSFEDLRVWQKGIELVKKVYLLTASGALQRDFGLRDQIRRASVSIPTNRRRIRARITQGVFTISQYREGISRRG